MNLKFNILPEKIFPVKEYNNMILSYTMFGGMKLSFNQACIDSEIIIESPKAIKYTFVKLNNNFNESILQYIYLQDKHNNSRA